LKIRNIAGRKGKRNKRTKSYGLVPGRKVLAHGPPHSILAILRPFGRSFDEPYCLKETEAIRLGAKLLAQIKICSPARGGHFAKGSSRLFVVAMSFVKEFSEVYSPRKRSSTEANR
jgi:hypothetical protein